jgi:hypothetical protein
LAVLETVAGAEAVAEAIAVAEKNELDNNNEIKAGANPTTSELTTTTPALW